MTAPRLLGIDLGTTNTVVATIDEVDRPVIVRNGIGDDTTPSAVYFAADGTLVVGAAAREAATFDPDNGVLLVKRAMGTDHPLLLRGTLHTPESISAMILRYVAGGVEGTSAVITVPAYFGIAEHEATHQAGVIAGLDVLELVAEPVAAAAHYGLTTSGEPRAVLVYDFGGGTFDTTVLRIGGGDVEVVAVDGHPRLGGADLDERLLALVLDRLATSVGPSEIDDLRDDEPALASVGIEIERAKRELSTRAERELTVRWRGRSHRVALARRDLEVACSDLLGATYEIVERALDAALARGIANIDDVILVGGSSRIPAISEALERRTARTPRLVEPDLAVAKGAALRAFQLAGTRTPDRALAAGLTGRVVAAVPRSFGVLISDSTSEDGGEIVTHVVHANTPLPARATTTGFGTIVDEQDTVRIQVFEQAGAVASAHVTDNRRVLDGELTDIPPLPAGSPIELQFDVALDGRLTVTATEPRSGRSLRLTAYVDGVVDSDEATRLQHVVRGMTLVD